jgi:hypothetical protein
MSGSGDCGMQDFNIYKVDFAITALTIFVGMLIDCGARCVFGWFVYG